MIIEEYVALAPYTTLDIGGPARYFCHAKTDHDLDALILFARQNSLDIFILGKGSNILVSEAGFNGLVIKMEMLGVTFEERDDAVFVTIAAGELWDDIVREAIARGYYGIENLTGVPGTAGAALVQNIGCYGAEISHVLTAVHVINTKTQTRHILTNSECVFGYRDSIFKHPAGINYIITHIVLRLQKQGKISQSYHDIKNFFLDNAVSTPTLMDIRQAILHIRARKGMLIMDGYETYKTAGSFFKAPPYVAEEVFDRVHSIVMSENPEKARSLEPWFWRQADGCYKIAPAFLMEFTPFNRTDFFEKKFHGSVGISPKHTLSLINVDHATADDMYAFAQTIQDAVEKKFGILLEPEVCLVGLFV